MNKGFILIDVIICLIIMTLVVYLLFFALKLSNNTSNIIDIKIVNIDILLGYE